MRYCNKTKEIIESSYKTCSVDEIHKLIVDAELTERTVSNLTKYVNKLTKRDEIKEAKRKKFEEYALKDPIKYRAGTLYHSAKQRAKNKDIPFTLTRQWVEDKLKKGKCEVTNIKFEIKKYSKAGDYDCIHPHAPSLDQIEPSAGYTKENVQVVVDHFNKMRNDRDMESTVFLAKKIVSAHKRGKITF